MTREEAYCDRNICLRNEYNGINCDECEVTKSQEPCEDAISREVFEQVIWERDVAIAELKELGYRFGEKQPMGIWKVIEQEPSGDAVSRQFMKEMGATCIAKRNNENELIPIIAIDALPSIKPQKPTGHWIDREVYDADRWKCSECGRTEPYKENYCPNCGCLMVDPQEISDRNLKMWEEIYAEEKRRERSEE